MHAAIALRAKPQTAELRLCRFVSTKALAKQKRSDTTSNMGFWNGVKNVMTLGGSNRLDRARARYSASLTLQNQVIAQIREAEAYLDLAVKELKAQFRSTKRCLRKAHKMLKPQCIYEGHLYEPQQHSGSQQPHRYNSTALYGREVGVGSGELAFYGVSAGTSTAIIAWQGVQILGYASTGTAIGGISGIAATNAGWAAFGGGSLATGGGGMALGHLILPGFSVITGISVGAYLTHSRANELNRESDALDSAISTKQMSLQQINIEAKRFATAKAAFSKADLELRFEVKRASLKLRRFGLLSVLYRYLRLKLGGTYYMPNEWQYVQQLEAAIQRFMTTFGVSEAQN